MAQQADAAGIAPAQPPPHRGHPRAIRPEDREQRAGLDDDLKRRDRLAAEREQPGMASEQTIRIVIVAVILAAVSLIWRALMPALGRIAARTRRPWLARAGLSVALYAGTVAGIVALAAIADALFG